MGAYYSQDMESDYENDMKSKESELDVTPSQRLRHMRLLALDPRSPSTFIHRTPIIVNKTPDVPDDKLNWSKAVTETPPCDPVVKDPRSPTSEFTRTPINHVYHSSVANRQRVLTLPASFHHKEEPEHFCESVSDMDSPATSSVTKLSGITDSSVESLQSAISLGKESQVFSNKDTSLHKDAESSPDVSDASPIDADVTEGDDDDEGYEDMEIAPTIAEIKSHHRVKAVEEITPKLAVVMRSISHNRIGMKPKMLSLTPGITRSPLSTVMNSPRVVSSQRNILPPQGGGKPALGFRILHDKENVRY